jgi:uncharacterized protein (TIGR02646 family)
MIHIDRGPRPEGFDNRAQKWATRFQDEQKRDPKLTISQFWTRIRNEVRQDAAVLYGAFHGKCAFCESRMRHVSAPHIEHYRPKSQFPALAFIWENWLLSCGRCNDSKWAHFPDCSGQPCLIDPVTEDPVEHIEFVDFIALAKTQRGAETIRLVGLNRSPLEDERSQWLVSVNALLLLCLVPQFKTQARDLLIWSMQDDAPYAAMTRCYLAQKTPRLANPQQLHLRIELEDPIGRIQQLIEENTSILQDLP